MEEIFPGDDPFARRMDVAMPGAVFCMRHDGGSSEEINGFSNKLRGWAQRIGVDDVCRIENDPEAGMVLALSEQDSRSFRIAGDISSFRFNGKINVKNVCNFQCVNDRIAHVFPGFGTVVVRVITPYVITISRASTKRKRRHAQFLRRFRKNAKSSKSLIANVLVRMRHVVGCGDRGDFDLSRLSRAGDSIDGSRWNPLGQGRKADRRHVELDQMQTAGLNGVERFFKRLALVGFSENTQLQEIS